MTILAFESSCDETAVAVVRDGSEILSDCIASQVALHAPYGGVVPEIASRNHMAVIASLTTEALAQADCSMDDIDAIAVTAAPGLIGALLVGVNFAKTLAYKHSKPLIPVHHLRGHIAAGRLADSTLTPPFLALVVSGGHTLLIAVEGDTRFRILGSTRDDAVGEVFDKVARVLGLGYPGGPAIQRAAQAAPPDVMPISLPTPKLDGLDMSFSGIKTAFINETHRLKQRGLPLNEAALARDFQQHAVALLVSRMTDAYKQTGFAKWLLCGGVAANALLRSALTEAASACGCSLSIPPLSLCGDNAAMIAAAAFYEWNDGVRAGSNLNAYAVKDIDEPF